MNIDIRDAKTIGLLLPLEVAAYLKAKGWQAQPVKGSASVWTVVSAGENYEAQIPLDQSVRDYALRMGELLDTLAIAENRSQAAVLTDLLTTYADVIRIRIDDPEMKDGTVPIEVNAEIAQKVRDLFLAAACSATELRAFWHRRKPQQAVDQVRKLRVGQSERGSYVVTVISRVSPALHAPQNGQLFDVEPFERRVTQMLASSLSALDRTAATAALSQQYAVFGKAVSEGVSANLCDAVTGLSGDEDRDRRLEFTFAWSPARPVEPDVPSRVKFGPDRISVIREASRVMKELEPLDDFELEGAVVKLDRPLEQTDGRVTVMGTIDGKPRNVTLELEGSHYDLAISAHQHQQPFRCVGRLERQGRGFVLRDARDFAVVKD